MKTSKVFAIVKRYVNTTYEGIGENFICYAIERARGNRLISAADFNRAIGIISDRLDDHGTLERWLMSYHNIQIVQRQGCGCKKVYIEYRNRMQVTRHAWLDSLIAEFQSKGD